MINKAEQKPLSNVEKLTKIYKAVPGHLAFFAAAPGILIYAQGSALANMGPIYESNATTKMHLAGIAYCSILTIIPALPVGMTLTLGLALTSGLIAALSMPVAYPIALAMDKSNTIRNNAPNHPSKARLAIPSHFNFN